MKKVVTEHVNEENYPEANIMRSLQLIGWISFALFCFSVFIVIAVLVSPFIQSIEVTDPEAILWIIGVLSLIASVLGFVSFKTLQGKIGATGGLVLVLLVLLVLPTTSEFSRPV